MNPRAGWAAAAAGLVAAAATAAALAATPAAPPTGGAARDLAFFEARIRPLLVKRCLACHGEKAEQGGLRLDRADRLRRGGDSGPAVVPGKPDESLLIRAIRRTAGRLQMPPAGSLPAAEIALLAEWVERGAPFPESPGVGAAEGPLSLAAGRQFWSIRPLRRAPPPAVRRADWPRGPVDRYLLARIEAAGLAPAPAADRRTLIRRAHLALTGLPPTPEEVEAFVADPEPDPFPRLVDRLLASPHYGERWARHWLDLVRYCDIPEEWGRLEAQPWLYRDWVVRALNQDLPYPRFVQLQLAADQTPDAGAADLAALGFLGLSPTYWKELKLAPEVIRTVVAEEWEERINTVTGAFLGLTVACARCHDHKQDPISTRDYYALAGVFASIRQVARPLLPPEEAARVLAARKRVADLDTRAKQAEAAKTDAGKAQAAALRAEAAALRRDTPHYDAPTAYAVEDAGLHVLPDGPDRTRLDYRPGEALDVAVQVRGNPSREGAVVPRGFLTVLSPGEPTRFREGSGRRELSEAIFREAAPLAARVIVNRVWRHHFGRGLVETPSNFGTQGDRPSHPELLDDLAARFSAAGWSLKWLHREIMLSAAYRQGDAPAPSRAASVDPDNRLLARMPPRRLEVEAWRDSILAAAGTLDPRVGGAPEPLGAPGHRRRTLYGVVQRRELADLLRLYDFPDPTTHSPARFHTTTPLQQLFVLNGEFIGRQAAALARRARAAGEGLDGAVRRAHLLLYGRPPTAREAETARVFLGAEPGEAAWQQYAEVLLARSELMFAP